MGYSYLMFWAYVNITPLSMYRPDFSPFFGWAGHAHRFRGDFGDKKKIADGFPK